ncbi:MAG: 5-formyltetrahydrofolate cyclo-ligase [Pseudomonadota bacterium]
MLPPLAAFLDPKTILRERMKATRREAAAVRSDAGPHAARIFLDAFDFDDDAIIAIYYPIQTELDTSPLADALLEKNLRVALPVALKKKRFEKHAPAMTFRLFEKGAELIDGAFGEKIPSDTAATVRPTHVVAPLLAFTRAGDRLGYGGGYYDRALASLREDGPVVFIGYGFADQQVDAIPISPLDQKLDWVVTERGAVACGGSSLR